MITRSSWLVVVVALLAARSASAIDFPMTSFERFLRTDPADQVSPPLILALSDYSLVPGSTIHLVPLGRFDNGPNPDLPRPLFGVDIGIGVATA
jgi:hypothetical protein